MWRFIYGLIVGGGGMRLILWVQNENIRVGWYVWIMGAIAVLLGALTIQHFFASYKELEPKAAWMGVLFMGIPTLLLAGVATWLLLASS